MLAHNALLGKFGNAVRVAIGAAVIAARRREERRRTEDVRRVGEAARHGHAGKTEGARRAIYT